MAVTNKDFKVKYGLVVEGASALVNGNQVLTETASDTYILNLIGGETLVKSVSNEFDVSVAGELSIDRAVVDAYYDAAGSATAAETAANSYTDGRETAITSAYQSYADTAESDAISAAATYTDGRETAITAAYQSYADTAEADAISAAAADATTKANAAQTAAEGYADAAVAAIVDGAPALLDTLNELAAALQDNPDVISTIQTTAAGKQDALTAGANIDITGATISVTGLTSAEISDFNAAALSATAAAYDVAGAAATAESNAIAHADALDTDDIEEGVNNLYFSDVRAKISAAALLTGATLDNITITGDENGLTITAENGVADSDTDDLAEGTTNLYFQDSRAVDALEAVVPNFTAVEVNSVAKQVASTLTAATAGIQVGHAWAKAEYRSAEFLVKVAYGDHTEISKVLVTLDINDNIAITEYGVVGTNGSASTISAGISGTDVQLLVTTANNNSTVNVYGTLLA